MMWKKLAGLAVFSACAVFAADPTLEGFVFVEGGTFSVDSGKESHPCVEITWYGAAATRDAGCVYSRSVEISDSTDPGPGAGHGGQGVRRLWRARRTYQKLPNRFWTDRGQHE